MPNAASTKMDPAQAKRLVHRIINHHLGPAELADGEKAAPAKIEAIPGGLTNLVFRVQHDTGNLIVRIGADARKLSAFVKEQWAIIKARELSVPTPEVLQVGNEATDVPYMIARQSKGTEATYHPDRLRILDELARYAAIIHTIKTTGFGGTFDWSHNQLSHNATWGEFLKSELRMEEGFETLELNGMLDPPKIKKLRGILEGAAEGHRGPALNHGDLRLKNVLVNDKGKISCILDWEHCTSNLSPEWDLSIALHDLSIDEKQAFVAGYGVKGDELAAISPVLKAINLINYSGAVRSAQKSKNVAKLDRYRARFHGQLDLYSL